MPSEAFEKLYEVLKLHQLTPRIGLENLRAEYNNMAISFPVIEDAVFEDIEADGVRAEWIDSLESSPSLVMMYLHGGGYIMGTTKMYHNMLVRLANAAGVRVLTVDYRLAPENKFPAALNDSIKAYKWLLSKGYEPNKIVIAGDSAGGGLTLATLLKIRSLGLGMPAAAVCVSPWTDLALTSKSLQANSKIDPVLDYNLLKYFADCCVGEEGDRCDPFVSPFYADLTGLPPLTVMVASDEVLLDEVCSDRQDYGNTSLLC